jgi:prepilin-type N-terminal cleavage/methylation domain-containing protein
MKPAFTLIELLVVVTIIVVLLALLTPALDKAIYQAELATDGAQMRGIGQACLAYAMEYNRTYPNRGPSSYTYSSSEIKSATQFSNPPMNFPKLLESYIAVRNFVDPFLAEARLDLDEAMRDPWSFLMPGYHMYIDWGNSGIKLSPMKKVGSKMVFTDPSGEVRRFGVIISDRDARFSNGSQTSHPDKDGVESFWSYHGGGNPWLGGTLVGNSEGAATGNFYVTWWQAPTGAKRGTVDNHYGIDDGSVLRLNDVPVVEVPGTVIQGEDDPRITFVPDVQNLDEYNRGRRTQLPRSAN